MLTFAELLPDTASSNSYDPVIGALPWPLVIACLVLPLAVAMLSRSMKAMLIAAVFSLAGLASLTMRGAGMEVLTALVLLTLGLAAAIHGFHDARRGREFTAIAAMLDAMRAETRTFLEALDRRAMIADRSFLEADGSLAPERQVPPAAPAAPPPGS